MTPQVTWDSSANPIGTGLHNILYEIKRADSGEGLIFDACTMADILEDSEQVMILDALVTPYAKLQRKMQVLKTVMDRHSDTIKVEALQISDPFKQSGVAQVAAIFELSDGQTVSIFFHNPDVDPKKIQMGDELISWRWMLNKRDITVVVAPERGQDLNIKTVAERIMKLAEKNSPAFIRANAKRAEKMQAIESIKFEIVSLEAELKSVQHELEVAKAEAEDRMMFNPISPQGYKKVLADPILQQQYQETLNKFFEWRINEIKKTLLNMSKWVTDDKNNLFFYDQDSDYAISGQRRPQPPSAHRTVRTGPYTAPHARRTH